MPKISYFVFVAVLLLTSAHLHAQNISADSLENKVKLLNKTQAAGVLYLTTDKTLYLPTEVIWFTAFLLDGIAKQDSLKADILSVTLVKENATIASRKDYYITNGICAGSLTLPDTIPPGNYQLVACTNIVNPKGVPLQIFRTPITIKTTINASVSTDFNILDRPKSDSLFIETHTYISDAGTAAGKKKNSIEYYFLDQKPRTSRLDPLGVAKIALPLADVKVSNHILYTVTTFEGSKKYFNLHLPLQVPDSIRIRFYPEGGDLVTGLSSRVAWESSSPDARPIAAKALLLENGTVRDTLYTDSMGIGLFNLQPRSNCVYTLKTINSGNTMPSQVFTLPKALAQGFVLEIADAVVNDTLAINISASIPGAVSLAFTSIFTNASVVSPLLHLEKGKNLLLPLDNISKGLNTITLLDEQGRPLAERLFFAHFNSKNKVEITTDKDIYKPRDIVTTNVALTDAQGKPISGVFTMSCVQLNRMVSNPKENIEAYYYVEHWLKTKYDNQPITNLYKSKPYLEKQLLVKGWRRYTWLQLMQVNAQKAALSVPQKLNFLGKVQFDGGYDTKKPLMLYTQHDSVATITETDSKGYFSPKLQLLVIREDSPPIRFQAFEDNKKSNASFIVTLTDPMETLIQASDYPPVYNYVNVSNIALQSTKLQQLKGESFFNRQLKTVFIKDRPVYHTAGYGANECGDYVCAWNVLNCPNHVFFEGNHPPVKGQSYFRHNSTNSPVKIVYQGCQLNNLNNIPGIYTAREFYGVDTTGFTISTEKTYLSTLFWKSVVIASGKRTIASYYASDLQGTYKITIEGVSTNGEVLNGEKLFMVKQ